MELKYKLNIQRAMIHSMVHPCPQSKRMKEANAKYFSTYDEARNYYGGDKKAERCSLCKFD